MIVFQEEQLSKLYKPRPIGKGNNGQVLIIGGSSLFHGAPLLALKIASRIVDMVFFTSPEPSLGETAAQLKNSLSSFIWFPFDQVEEYIKKSDAILIGPGLMRYHKKSKRVHSESSLRGAKEQENRKVQDKVGNQTKKITELLLKRFPQKQWVIDAGSLQVMGQEFISIRQPAERNKVPAEGRVLIPQNAILTPNKKEYKMLFKEELPKNIVKKYHCILVLKNAETEVFSEQEEVLVKGGNYGMIKGGTGDVLAGLISALATKNPPFLAASAASFLVKKAADELYQKVGFTYNADDLAEKVPEVLGRYFR